VGFVNGYNRVRFRHGLRSFLSKSILLHFGVRSGGTGANLAARRVLVSRSWPYHFSLVRNLGILLQAGPTKPLASGPFDRGLLVIAGWTSFAFGQSLYGR
jgi:hypothetical protein